MTAKMLAAGLDLNGVWDHRVRIDVKHGEIENADDLGARSVVVRAKHVDGGSILIGGKEALESVYGRGENVFGPVGRTIRRKEVAEAWREIRGEYEPESLYLLTQDENEDEEKIDHESALLAQALSALGQVEDGGATIMAAGLVMRDDEATTEAVQDDVRRILGRHFLQGVRCDLIWDSIAVAKAAILDCPDLRTGANIAIILSYGKQIRTYRVTIKEDNSREGGDKRTPERFPPQVQLDPCGSTANNRIWHEGWEGSLNILRSAHDREKRAVFRQTRQGEEWVQGDQAKAVVRVKNAGGRPNWTAFSPPWMPGMQRPLSNIEIGPDCSMAVVWTPMGRTATKLLASCVKAEGVPIRVAAASWAAEGAALAARDLNRGWVPWFDRLDRMSIKVRRDGEEEELVLIDDTESVPAGTAYRTGDERALEISKNVYLERDRLFVSLPLTKGQGNEKWSKTEQVKLETKPKKRAKVELRARQTPGQGSAVIELRSDDYPPWRDAPWIVQFRRDVPDQHDVNPALIRYEPSKDAWNRTNGPHALRQAAAALETPGGSLTDLQILAVRKWLQAPLGNPPLHKEHAVGTNGRLPNNVLPDDRTALDRILDWTEKTLLERTQDGTLENFKPATLNALHGIHTWCFAKAKNDVLELLIQATEGVEEIQRQLLWDKDGARRSIWQGLGRSLTMRESIERVLDGALRNACDSEANTDLWACDALACASHLLARRHIAGLLVLNDGRRAEEAAMIVCDKVRRMSECIRHVPKNTFIMQPGLQLRYAVLLAGGLARVKAMEAERLQRGSSLADSLASALHHAIEKIDAQSGWTVAYAKGLRPIMEALRNVFEGGEQPDANLLKLLDR